MKKDHKLHPVPTDTPQPSRIASAAVELDTAPALLLAAPVLLGIRPALHPVGEASTAVVDTTMLMANSGREDMGVQMIAAMPRAGATHLHVTAAPGLLVCRPSEVPVGVALLAVVVEGRSRGWLIDDVRLGMHIASVVDYPSLWAKVDGNVDDPAGRSHRHMDFVIHHLGVRVVHASTPIGVAAVSFLLLIPKVLPVMEALHTGKLDLIRSRLRPEPPEQVSSGGRGCLTGLPRAVGKSRRGENSMHFHYTHNLPADKIPRPSKNKRPVRPRQHERSLSRVSHSHA